METKDNRNEQDLPEKGATNPEKETVENEVVNEAEKVEEVKEEATEVKAVEGDAKESVAEESESSEVEKTEKETEENKQSKSLEKEDYSVYDRTVLLTKLNELVNNYDVETSKDAVEEIKTNFYKKYKAEVAEARKTYVDGGGNPEDFKFHDETSEETFKVIYNQFKEKKGELNEKQEEEKQLNLEEKYKIIEEIKELINKEESINKTFQEFRDLQQRWRDIGLVPQNQVKNLWEHYNHHVEKFYDYIKINKELRDLDLKKNLEQKIELCEKAEALLLEDSITRAFKTLQEYHHQWREIGPVPREQKDDIWERFKAATTQINKKHQEYFEGLKDQQYKNLDQKEALCERVEEILKESYDTPKEWEGKAQEVIEIQKLWRTIGFAPKKDNNRIYHRFKGACDEFFTHKRDFYKATKEGQKNNLQLKLDLCVQAEALKDSTEWKKTTEDFVNLQRRWKEIGPVPKKHSDALWKRFRTACDHFFIQKSEFFNTADSRQDDNLKLKLELIDKVKGFKKLDDDKESLQVLMDIQKEWTEIGHVPLAKKDEVQKDFREAINEQFEQLKIDNSEREKLNFQTKVESWVSNNSRNKLYAERNKLINKIRELENEISLYENNIGFFSKSSNSNALMKDVTRKIERAKERMESLKERLQLLDSIDQ